MKRDNKLRCIVCGRYFRPNKFAWRQQVCSRKACRREHHRQSCEQWRRANPDHFRIREDNSSWAEGRRKAQVRRAKQHPDDQRRWRTKNKERWREYMREYMRRRRAETIS